MDTTTFPPGTITCAKPGCGTQASLAESVFIDGCGQVCQACGGGPTPEWLADIEPPF